MEADVYQRIKYAARTLLNIDLEQYKDAQMRRRLDSWLTRKQIATWDEYIHLVRRDAEERERFRAYLTINVSAFFRDITRWQEFDRKIIRSLHQTACTSLNPTGALRIWSAGCSIGAEIYSLAMLCEQFTPGQSHFLLATDIDRDALAQARAGGPYANTEVQNISKAQRLTYFQKGGPPFYIKHSLAQKIEFREHNLLADPFDSGFDLILCRNVIIYFTDAAKEGLYRKFSQALRPGGILFLGSTEIISRPSDFGMRGIGMSFYEKCE